MPQTVDRIDFACMDVDPSQWPKLSCGGSNLLQLEAGSLQLEAGRTVTFADNGQVRSFDDTHKLVFNRTGNLLELHEAGDIRFLTGAPTPTEKLRIRANGSVGIGTNTPGAMLHVVGDLRSDGSLRVQNAATINGPLTVAGVTNFRADTQVQGNLQVSGFIDAPDLRRNGISLTSSQWTDVAGGINYAGGSVGIGTTTVHRTLHTEGGEIHSGGAGGGLSFSDRAAPTFVDVPPNGERWVWYATSGMARLWSGNDKVTITPSGNVGIGAISPAAKLEIEGDLALHPMSAQAPRTLPTHGTLIWNDGTWLRLNQNLDFAKPIFGVHTPGLFAPNSLNVGGIGSWNDPGEGNVWVAGSVAIGTTTPGFRLDVADRMRVRQGGSGSAGIWLHQAAPDNDRAFVGMANDNEVGFWGNTGVGWGLIMDTSNGNVTIRGALGTLGWPATPRTPGWGGGIHTWDVEAEGTMWSRAGYQSGNRDLAENYAATTSLEPGDVVCLDRVEDKVTLSGQANDVAVIGVVSTAPGVLLNENHDTAAGTLFPIALCGRVPCKVVAENGPIQRGDLLTASSTPGHAMKAEPITVDGHLLYRPGTILGKALASLTAGAGVIEVFVSAG